MGISILINLRFWAEGRLGPPWAPAGSCPQLGLGLLSAGIRETVLSRQCQVSQCLVWLMTSAPVLTDLTILKLPGFSFCPSLLLQAYFLLLTSGRRRGSVLLRLLRKPRLSVKYKHRFTAYFQIKMLGTFQSQHAEDRGGL